MALTQKLVSIKYHQLDADQIAALKALASGKEKIVNAADLLPFLAQALLDVSQTANDAIRIVGELEQVRNRLHKS